MAISITDGIILLSLPIDYYWSDEHTWSPVKQTTQRSLTGALVVSVATEISGRPITLQSMTDEEAWMPLSTLNQLRQWAAGAGKELQLTLRGEVRTVIFNHEGGAIEAAPVKHMNDVQSDDWYVVTLRFLEVNP